ncbi:uncharacterized protein TNCV_1814641 [Trichonephila clavipes]|nr:uncharacterized protein TNCV_1814641 [Trichonephila clavipes]
MAKLRNLGSLVVRASDSRPEGLGSMLDVTKYPPSAHGFTCRNCGGGDRGRVAIYRPFGEVSLSLNRTVTCMVLKANDRRTSCPCHDEFRGPRSDYVRQLCDQKLLRKCLHGKTQNANEAFNGCLWNVVPKEIFVELQKFSLGSHIAVINFNKVFTGLLSVLEALGIKIGSYTIRGYAAIDKTRIEDSKRPIFAQFKIIPEKKSSS